MKPSITTLTRWHATYTARKKAAYQKLIASYTPEQRVIVDEMNEASRQAKLCLDRSRHPEGATGKRRSQVVWPSPPQ